ncbi:MAG: flagellar basal body rod C-terminal domain-containing protein [Fibrobacterota bacterium]
MDSIYSIASSGMRTANIRHDITAHDVANINTEGFEERTPIQKETNPGTDIASIRRTPNSEPFGRSNTELAKEMPEMSVNKTTYKANADVIRKQDEMTGTLLDMIG